MILEIIKIVLLSVYLLGVLFFVLILPVSGGKDIFVTLITSILWPVILIVFLISNSKIKKQKNDNEDIFEAEYRVIEHDEANEFSWEKWAKEMREPTEEELDFFYELRKEKHKKKE